MPAEALCYPMSFELPHFNLRTTLRAPCDRYNLHFAARKKKRVSVRPNNLPKFTELTRQSCSRNQGNPPPPPPVARRRICGAGQQNASQFHNQGGKTGWDLALKGNGRSLLLRWWFFSLTQLPFPSQYSEVTGAMAPFSQLFLNDGHPIPPQDHQFRSLPG